MGSSQKLSRRELLGLGTMTAGTAAALSLMSGCGPDGDPDRLTLRTWSPDTRDAALASERWWHDAFMAANPQLRVEQLTVPYDEDTVKLKAAHRAGTNVPDILWTYNQNLYAYGLEGLVRPLNDLMSRIGPDRYPRQVLDGIRVEGTYYSVPFVGFPFFVYCRKDLYAAKGLRPPETHGELLENVAALHDPPSRYGYLLTNQYIADTFNLKTAMWTHGAYFFDAEDNLALDRPETLRAWAFYKELGKYSPPGSMAQGDLESRELMLDGRVAHMFTTTSFAADFGPEDLTRLGAFTYPIQPGARGASLDFNALALPARSKQPELAKDMIGFLLEPENFQEFLTRTVVGWVPMLEDAWTDRYLNHPRIAAVREYLEVGRISQETGIVSTGYFGPSRHSRVLIATDIEKQIGDRLVVFDQSPDEVLEWADSVLRKALA
ncbi:MAG: extracellular solute-binding protein [Candidatus Aminicenantes bacterium]|nr:extracellular solute-binding protein [Candidatus Aminicenantes bacterium]